MALTDLFLAEELESNTYLARKRQQYRSILDLLANADECIINRCRSRYAELVERQSMWLKDLQEADYTEEEPLLELANLRSLIGNAGGSGDECEAVAVELAFGGLYYLIDNPSPETLADFCTVYHLLGLPFLIVVDFLANVSDEDKLTLIQVTQKWINNRREHGGILNLRVKIREEGKGTWEESAFTSYQEGLQEGNIGKVERFMVSFRVGHRNYLGGPVAVLLALAYSLDKELFMAVVGRDASPVMVRLVCEATPYGWDLPLLEMLAQRGGLWTRLEIAEHLIDLAQQRRAGIALKTREKACSRLLAVYLGRVLLQLIQTRHEGVLAYILKMMMRYSPQDGRYLVFVVGKYIGAGLARFADSNFIRSEMGRWRPFMAPVSGYPEDNTAQLLSGVQCALYEKATELFTAWNNMLISIWLRHVYKCYHGDSSAFHLPFTSLDWPVHTALQHRWRDKEASMRFIRGVLRRLKLVESTWFKDSVNETLRNKALYALIMAHAFAWANLPPHDAQLPGVVNEILTHIRDKRNWDREPGLSWEQVPPCFAEIERAYRYGVMAT